MNCVDVRDRLDDHVDRLLETGESEAVRAHLATCPDCRAEETARVDLARRTAELPREIEPQDDLWPAIRSRIGAGSAAQGASPGSPWRRRSLAMVGAAAAVVTAVLLVMAYRNPVESPVADVIPVGNASVGGAILASYDEAEDEFRRTREILLAELEAKRGDLDPATVQVVIENLEEMERAAAEIREALQNDPGNRALKSMLLASYRKQVGLLKHFREIPESL